MKSTGLNIFQLNVFLLFIFVSSNIQAAKVPLQSKPGVYSYELIHGQKMSIQFVSSKLIKVQGKEYALGASTKVFGKQGEKLDLSVLKKDMVISIVFDDKQRFLNRPTLSRIYVYVF